MPLPSGTKLGPYQIVDAIGAGGMGEVYRARDTRLDRMVAIKILPPRLASNPDLKQRFEREAKAISSLLHPHICTLFDVGHQNGTDFLVMEYLDGQTLAARLTKGALPPDQVLQYAIQIADALDKAHRKGITHRDLKPANIMLTKSGAKLLDFGLAKLRPQPAPAVSPSEDATAKEPPTAEGTILGTLQYMSPEQLEAKETDARTDIFAFGVVVYEMATGKKAFEGKSQASLIAKILETEPPPISSLQPMTPPALDRVVKRCLAKEPDQRWQTANDLCHELMWISNSGTHTDAAVAAAARRKAKKPLAWAAAAIVVMAVFGAIAGRQLRHSSPEMRQTVRFTVGPPEKGSFSPQSLSLSVSPDGSKLAYVAADSSGKFQLWVRPLDSSAAQPLVGTDNAVLPFWSPDSRFLGFFAEGKLKKISISGGPPQILTEQHSDSLTGGISGAGGGTWNREGVILFAEGGSGSPIYRVSASGGAATPVITPDGAKQERGYVGPSFLPDGKHFLYRAVTLKPEDDGIYVGLLDSQQRRLLLNVNSNPTYAPGYLLFYRQGTVVAQPLDAERMRLGGEAVPIAEGVLTAGGGGRAYFDASGNGVLAYRGGAATEASLKLVWVDRKGAEQPTPAPIRNYYAPRIAPDGERVALAIGTIRDAQIWIYDLRRDTLTRLTFDGTGNIGPVWTPDGKRIVFKGTRNGLFWQPADGSGGAEALTTSDLSGNNIPGSFTPDGRVLAFTEERAARNIWLLALEDRKPRSFMQSAAYETAPRFSPDGRWIAYDSRESGRDEIYVRPYPGPGGRWQISTEGGTEPVWNRNGRELFYRSKSKMMAVDVSTQSAFSAGKPRMLFEGAYVPTPLSFPDYDVSADGQRFLMLKALDPTPVAGQINVVVNWTAALKK